MPVAVNCSAIPRGELEAAEVTCMDWRVAAVTVIDAVACTVPETAVMLVDPAATAVANPALLMVATAVFDDAQVTVEGSIALLVLSEYVPVTVKAWVFPAIMDLEDGEISIELSVAVVLLQAATNAPIPRNAKRDTDFLKNDMDTPSHSQWCQIATSGPCRSLIILVS